MKLKKLAGAYVKFANPPEHEIVKQQTKSLIVSTKNSWYKKGIQASIKDIQYGEMHDDFVKDLFTIVTRYWLTKIPRFANPVYKK